MAGEPDKKKLEQFRQYLGEQTVFIVDTASASRRRLSKMINDLGAKSAQIKLYGRFEEAESEFAQYQPRVILADFMLGNRSGLELLQKQREIFPDSQNSIFVLITADSSQSAVARAAEEDVDSFILKPYTVQSFTQTLVDTATSKLFPSEYRKTIEDGKKLLFGGKPEESLPLFEKAMKMDPKPALACFYYGQAETAVKEMQAAQGSFQKGLGYNNIHYKCLVGLFDLFMNDRKYQAAYDIVQRIAKYFPANPKRLCSILWLSVVNRRYEDIDSYYDAFKNMEVREEEVVRHMCAALIVSGKYFLRNQEEDRGQTCLRNACISAGGRTQFLRRAIETMARHKKDKDAQDALKRFPADTQNQTDFLVSKFLVDNLVGTAETMIPVGQRLIKDKHYCPRMEEELIRRMFEAEMVDDARLLIQDSSKRWPEFAAFYQSLDPESANAGEIIAS